MKRRYFMKSGLLGLLLPLGPRGRAFARSRGDEAPIKPQEQGPIIKIVAYGFGALCAAKMLQDSTSIPGHIEFIGMDHDGTSKSFSKLLLWFGRIPEPNTLLNIRRPTGGIGIEQCQAEITTALKGTDQVILVVILCGGPSTKVWKAVTHAARDVGAKVSAVVMVQSWWPGEQPTRGDLREVSALEKFADTVHVVHASGIIAEYSRHHGSFDFDLDSDCLGVFKYGHEVMCRHVRQICGIS